MIVHSLASQFARFVVIVRQMYWTPPPSDHWTPPPLLKSDDLFLGNQEILDSPFKNPGHAPELYLNIMFIYINSLTIFSPGTTCFRCPAYSGLFPDPFDCEKFYHCDHWIAYHKDCPLRDTASTRLHFNDRLKVR